MKKADQKSFKHCQKTVSFISILLILLFFMFSCGSNSNDSDSTTTESGGTIQGLVFDDDSLQGLENVKVSVGNLRTVTGDDGEFEITGVPSGEHTVTVSKNDYYTGSETVQVTEGAVTSTVISMFFNADNWLETNTSYNWQVEAVREDGTVVSGPVWSFSTDGQKSLSPVTDSKNVSEDSVMKIASTFLENMGQSNRSIESVDVIKNRAGKTLAFLVSLNPGYVVIPAIKSEALPPILAYSFTENFNPGDRGSHSLLNLIRTDIQLRLSALKDGKTPRNMSEKNLSLWNSYLSGDRSIIKKQRTVYGPLIDTPTWNQKDPYNNLCPMDPETSERCLVGCVATAYSQIFNYWKMPTTITFTSNDDYTTYTRKISVKAEKASFSDLSYQDNDDVKAKVSFACGVIARMNYTSENSSADTIGMGKTISKRYGYGQTSDIRFTGNDDFSSDKIMDNIKATPTPYPVVMSITKVDNQGNWKGGHAIICDGYDEGADTFHLNMGWAGSRDGWYSLPAGMPARYAVVKGYVYNIAPYDNDSEKIYAQTPQNPYPPDGEKSVTIDETLDWDQCENVKYYNCYVWKSSGEKPSRPTFQNLPEAVAYPELLSR